MDTAPTHEPAIDHTAYRQAQQTEIAVKKGAQFLDTAVPDWAQPSCATPIDLRSFDIANFSHCILGQLCAHHLVNSHYDYRDWMQAIQRRFAHTAAPVPQTTADFQAWTHAHGFYPPPTMPIDAWQQMAQAAWTAEITDRRSQIAHAGQP